MNNSVSTLKNYSIESALLDAQLLLAYVLNVDKDYIILHPNIEIPSEQEKQIQKLIMRRAKHEPLQYITNKAYFYDLEFFVNENVLIPRPDTEILVETVLNTVSEEKFILDIGTGSGCIAISLAKNLPNAKIDAIDISKNALKIAEQNAGNNGVYIDFHNADITNNYQLTTKNYDIIVSNPPYIPSNQCRTLMPEVSNYEPQTALDGGPDGLDFYRHIADFAAAHLAPNGVVALEIGQNQEQNIEKIFNQNNFILQSQTKDLSGIIRVLVFKQ